MRNPENVLNSLASKAQHDGYKYRRLYRNLYNKEFFLLAYKRIKGHPPDDRSLERIDCLIESMKDESYQPNPVNSVSSPGANGTKRPLGVPSLTDKLVQEILRMMLEAIYDRSFSDHSHGFRPRRSCHTALTEVRKTFTWVKWFVEGDIKRFFGQMDHHVLVNILGNRIDDEKFLRLIRKFLRAGYLNDWKYHRTYSGTPQGGIISPVLSNIYLNELDQYIDKLKENFTQDDRNIPDSRYKRLYYVRYAGDFLIGIIGSKDDAKGVKEELAEFLKEKLNLQLSGEEMKITHSEKPARFLGYDIRVSRKHKGPAGSGGGSSGSPLKCKLYVPHEVWKKKLLESGSLEIAKNGKWKSKHRSSLIRLDDCAILDTYNAEIRGLYHYYRLASNVSVLNKYYHIMKYSLYKTLAGKYRTTTRKIIKKYEVNKVFTVTCETGNGIRTRALYHEGFARQADPSEDNRVDYLPKAAKYINK